MMTLNKKREENQKLIANQRIKKKMRMINQINRINLAYLNITKVWI